MQTQIKRFALIPSELTVATGEMTPTIKVKRRVVEQRWRAVIDTLHEESEQARRLT
jgi:long-chain acyl-CoA synthetase